MRSRAASAVAALAMASYAGAARADVGEDRFSAAGYLRVMTRPDFQGGDGRLGFWNLYGRLLNEGPWAALALKMNVLPHEPGSAQPWTSLLFRVEGGSILNVDDGGGTLDHFRVSQLAVQAGNLLLRDVTWQIGTLDYSFGDLGLYDLRPAQMFGDTVGAFAKLDKKKVELVVGVGDAGWNLRGAQYDTVLTAGASARLRLGAGGGGLHAEVGAGAQGYVEPSNAGNKFAPHATPDVDYADLLRGEVVERWLDDHPGMLAQFPDPESRSASGYKAIGYVGVGGAGPLRWNSLFVNYTKLLPRQFVTETAQGKDVPIYLADLTDERSVLTIGDEAHLQVVPKRMDAVVGLLYGRHRDGDNDVAPSDDDRWYWSVVARGEGYLTRGVHLLAETSYAVEQSTEGNLYRDHEDSVFTSTNGLQDNRGLEFGDDDRRVTWQGKVGVVLSPLGTGIYTRPALRLLYGVQHSTQNLAFGNSFAQSLDDNETFTPVERHWHHVIALEAEAWF